MGSIPVAGAITKEPSLAVGSFVMTSVRRSNSANEIKNRFEAFYS